jgi:lauroyl/myristoyl acyltransferase
MSGSNESDKVPLVRIRDFVELALFVFLGLMTVFLPIGRWQGLCERVAGLRRRFASKEKNQNVLWVDHVLSCTGQPARENVARDKLSMALLFRMQLADHYLRRRWTPVIRMSGLDHIENALENGKGVILWVSMSIFSDLIVKRGIHQAGYRVNHLSRPSHGFADSRFGHRYLNKLKTNVEEKYLERRIVIEDRKESEAVFKLRCLLKENKIVSITILGNPDSSGVFSLFGKPVETSTGPLRLARSTGSPVLPVFAFKIQGLDYELTVEPAINYGNGKDGDNWSGALDRYGGLLEKHAERHPLQWRSGVYFGNMS